MEVEFIINGISAPAKQTIESIYQRMNDSINERARKLVEKELEKASEIISMYEKILRESKNQLEQKLIDEGCYNYAEEM